MVSKSEDHVELDISWDSSPPTDDVESQEDELSCITDTNTNSQEFSKDFSEKGAQGSTLSLKLKVVSFLVVTLLFLCFLVAFLSLGWDDDIFQKGYARDAKQLLEHIGIQAGLNLETMVSLGTYLTSSATAQGALMLSGPPTWPFVTAPDFPFQAAHALDVLNASRVFFSPTVAADDRMAWEAYSNHHQDWHDETRIAPKIFKVNEFGNKTFDHGPAPFYPVWQMAPPDSADIKFNLRSIPTLAVGMDLVYRNKAGVITAPIPEGNQEYATINERAIMEQLDLFTVAGQQEEETVSVILFPVFDAFFGQEDRSPVGVLVAPFLWSAYLVNAMGAGTEGLQAVFHSCGKSFTYQVNGKEVLFLGQGDLHDLFYDQYKQTGDFPSLLSSTGFTETSDGVGFDETYPCPFQIDVYPTAAYQNHNTTSGPVVATVFMVLLSGSIFLLFLVFGGKTEDKFEELSKQAAESTRLIDTIFPKDIQERLLRGGENESQSLMLDDPLSKLKAALDDDPLSKLKSYLGESNNLASAPIADLWPHCTVLFGDLAGFSAWSACREPVQVFTLLETLFKAFDASAKRRGVYKVETVGDAYVAVVGCPQPKKAHATIMARFAMDCIGLTTRITRELEPQLGPDTGDLQIRLGLNSGPVTAGVIRGDKGRFQLFGETVNTAAWLESTGLPNRIHASHATAELLKQADKAKWVFERKDVVQTKAKGSIKTYWLELPSRGTEALRESADNWNSMLGHSRIDRLIDWNVQVFEKLLKEIVAYRDSSSSNRSQSSGSSPATPTSSIKTKPAGGTLIDEVLDIMEVDEPAPVVCPIPAEETTLDPVVKYELREFIRRVACLYHQNPFHNFEHASHVTMAVTKILHRVVAPSATDVMSDGSSKKEEDQSYGLKSNPLTQFAVVFGALIHDADHPGVPNSQLVLEGTQMAITFKNKSVAEQNSLQLCLNLIQDDMFKNLFDAICATGKEKLHFRQLVVNTVLATDIMDKELKELRNARWEKAFEEGPENGNEKRNAKATIVIEHLIQASDVAHTMQHWHVYQKWNERLFLELYTAYKAGRMGKDPSTFWYKGEMGFFDNYVIPLAKKLRDCGVFGVSSEEFLNYARSNRDEWQQKGEQMVAEYMKKIEASEEKAPVKVGV